MTTHEEQDKKQFCPQNPFIAENGSLGHWKTIIEKAYASFQAKLPGSEPSLFSSQVLATDGRSEGSKYPNLVLPEERERYGL